MKAGETAADWLKRRLLVTGFRGSGCGQSQKVTKLQHLWQAGGGGVDLDVMVALVTCQECAPCGFGL